MKNNRWNTAITLLLSVLFGLSAGIFLSQGRILFQRGHAGASSVSALRADLAVEKAKFDQLSERQNALETRKRALLQIYNENRPGEQQYEEWKEYAFLSGMTDVAGSGLTITLNDKPDYDPMNDPIESIVHDSTITHVLGLLWSSGARAVALNGVRMTAVAEISCVGPTIMGYGMRLMPPYVIQAIGPSAAMRNAVEGDSWIARLRQSETGVRLTMAEEEALRIPSFSKTHDFRPYMDLLLPVSAS